MTETPLSRRRRLLFPLLAAALGVAAAIGLLEVLLRLAPGILPPSLGNHVYSKYGTFPGGIYYHEEATGMLFMRRDFRTRAYWNGYLWEHRTDGLGFRSPELADRSLLLLGDSLIYGHGVEEEETVAHLLRAEHGRPAYNMGRQGDCIYQDYILFRLFADRLGARRVLLFVFANDFHDLLAARSAEELARAPEIARTGYDDLHRRIGELDAERQGGGRLLVRRLAGGIEAELEGSTLGELLGRRRPGAGAAGHGGPPHPSIRTLLDRDRFGLAAGYYRRALADLGERSRARGMRLDLVFLDLGDVVGPRWRPAQRRLGRFLRRAARAASVPYHSTRGLWEGCRDCFLPNDGHLTAAGHRRLARFLEAEVLDRPPRHEGRRRRIRREGLALGGELVLEPGEYTLRTLVRNSVTGAVGVQTTELVVQAGAAVGS